MLSVKKVYTCFVSNNLFKYVRLSVTSRNCSIISAPSSNAVVNKEREHFLDVWPGLVESIVQSRKITTSPEVALWFKQVLDYNTLGGKLVRGLSTVRTYENVEQPNRISEDRLKAARILGWCVEMLQGYLTIGDDIMDEATTRRGVPCYYTLPEVGPRVLNDSTLLLTSMYQALKIHFGDHPCYQRMVQQFNDIFYLTCIGQYLDYVTGKDNKDYSYFTIQRYEDIVQHKAAYYSFQLPVSLGLLLANITDPEVHRKVESICMQLGKLYQMQNDYVDCCDEGSTGKALSDIRGGKCTWFAVQALNRCSGPQKVVFRTCYGSSQPAHIERIENLYKQLKLKDLFQEEERDLFNDIAKQREQLELSTGVPGRLVMLLLDMLDKTRQAGFSLSL